MIFTIWSSFATTDFSQAAPVKSQEFIMNSPVNNVDIFIAGELKKGRKPNRLLQEKSPYLLQHAFNPVQWLPWGEEAFQKAKKENKPVFLSIGYSTCHWCHVMARESFENQAIADILNRYFICIKVDREERPDVDQIYMAAVQAMTSHGGWPLSVFLTPDLKPFYGGTYFPPDGGYGLPGFASLLNKIHEAWVDNRQVLLENAENVTSYLHEGGKQVDVSPLTAAISATTFEKYSAEFDKTHGGFGRAPKFPRPVTFNFLLRYHYYRQNEAALAMALFTLRKMAAGGIYDHIGGGFHRYSVDEQWRVPHFEKMLYDQGQLALSYLEAFQLSHDRFYATVSEDILDYVIRELRDPEGGFFSATDADSGDFERPEIHGEGLYYLWKEKEIEHILGAENAAVFKFHYGVQRHGNALADPQHEFTDKNILHIAQPLEATAENFKISVSAVAALLEKSRLALYAARKLKPAPHLDDKIITSWNSYMISALARAYQVLAKAEYLAAAEKSAAFLIAKLYDHEKKRLSRSYRAGHVGAEATLDDYAFLINALLDLYETDFDITWLQRAVQLMQIQIDLFEDRTGGGFFDTTVQKNLLVRMKADYDGAEPTGNSATALNLLRMGTILDNKDWLKKAENIFHAFSSRLAGNPGMLPQMLGAYEFMGRKPLQVVIAGRRGAEDTRKMLSEVHKLFIPNRVLLLADGAEGQDYLKGFLPFMAEVQMVDGKATAYICKNFSCQRPTTDPLSVPAILQSRDF